MCSVDSAPSRGRNIYQTLAARAVLTGDATSTPKAHNGLAEVLRILSVVRRSSVKASRSRRWQLTELKHPSSECPKKLDHGMSLWDGPDAQASEGMEQVPDWDAAAQTAPDPEVDQLIIW